MSQQKQKLLDDNKLAKQLQKVQRDNELLRKKLAELAAKASTSGAGVEEPSLQEQLEGLEEQRKFFEKWGRSEELAKVIAEVKSVKL